MSSYRASLCTRGNFNQWKFDDKRVIRQQSRLTLSSPSLFGASAAPSVFLAVLAVNFPRGNYKLHGYAVALIDRIKLTD